jgi:5-methyltetrahydrofolate--homocysteine methyltransferase
MNICMLEDNMDNELVCLVSDLEEQEALRVVREGLAEGVAPSAILADTRKALDIVGERYEASEYFIPDLMYAGAIAGQILDIVKPRIQEANDQTEPVGKMLIGTVAGDIHDIGKNVMVFLLEANGFRVKDLGIDVGKEVFVEEIKSFQPDIVGLSGLLTSVFETMKETVDAIEAAGLRDGRNIIIGGGQVDETVKDYTGADGFAADAGVGIQQCLSWMGEARK